MPGQIDEAKELLIFLTVILVFMDDAPVRTPVGDGRERGIIRRLGPIPKIEDDRGDGRDPFDSAGGDRTAIAADVPTVTEMDVVVVQRHRPEPLHLGKKRVHIDDGPAPTVTEQRQVAYASHVDEQVGLAHQIADPVTRSAIDPARSAVKVDDGDTHAVGCDQLANEPQTSIRMVDPLAARGIVARIRPPTFFQVNDVVSQPVKAEDVMKKARILPGTGCRTM